MADSVQRQPRRFVDEKLSHIAFIMDGNGRWAKRQGLPRELGHRAGAETFRRVTTYCRDIGMKAVTVYVLSTENILRRPKREVDALMQLLRRYLREAYDDAEKNRISFRFPGERGVLPADISGMMDEVEAVTAVYSPLHVLNLAINYGGRADITAAVNRLLASGAKNVTEDDITAALTTFNSPPPDLIVRTGGELRLSNFLLWDSAYSELYFTDTLWPDMTEDSVDDAVEAFYARQRRYGAI